MIIREKKIKDNSQQMPLEEEVDEDHYLCKPKSLANVHHSPNKTIQVQFKRRRRRSSLFLLNRQLNHQKLSAKEEERKPEVKNPLLLEVKPKPEVGPIMKVNRLEERKIGFRLKRSKSLFIQHHKRSNDTISGFTVILGVFLIVCHLIISTSFSLVILSAKHQTLNPQKFPLNSNSIAVKPTTGSEQQQQHRQLNRNKQVLALTDLGGGDTINENKKPPVMRVDSYISGRSQSGMKQLGEGRRGVESLINGFTLTTSNNQEQYTGDTKQVVVARQQQQQQQQQSNSSDLRLNNTMKSLLFDHLRSSEKRDAATGSGSSSNRKGADYNKVSIRKQAPKEKRDVEIQEEQNDGKVDIELSSSISNAEESGLALSQNGGGEEEGEEDKQNREHDLHEQDFEKRLMEWKQKYEANRAISDKAYYILLVIYSLFILIGTVSNSLICLTVILKPKILSPRNIFIVNLAGSDLLLCVFTMPFSFIEISMKMWQMGLIPCKLVAGLQATSVYVSTISITAIALDRYKVIVYPTHQETHGSTRRAALLLASVWFGALLLSSPLFQFRTVEHVNVKLPSVAHKYGTSIKAIDFCIEDWPLTHGRGIYSVISMIFQYVLPITIVSVVYAKISDKLQKRLIRRQRSTQLECQQKRQLNLIRRTHTMLISVSLIFGLSWLPLNLLNVVGDFTDLFKGDDQLFRVVFAICHLIGCSSACSNPILYGYLNENFRKEFHQVYTHHMRRLLRLLRSGGRASSGSTYLPPNASSTTTPTASDDNSSSNNRIHEDDDDDDDDDETSDIDDDEDDDYGSHNDSMLRQFSSSSRHQNQTTDRHHFQVGSMEASSRVAKAGGGRKQKGCKSALGNCADKLQPKQREAAAQQLSAAETAKSRSTSCQHLFPLLAISNCDSAGQQQTSLGHETTTKLTVEEAADLNGIKPKCSGLGKANSTSTPKEAPKGPSNSAAAAAAAAATATDDDDDDNETTMNNNPPTKSASSCALEVARRHNSKQAAGKKCTASSHYGSGSGTSFLGVSNDDEIAASSSSRRCSFQTNASSSNGNGRNHHHHQPLGLTMKFCLCLSGTSSTETLGATTAHHQHLTSAQTATAAAAAQKQPSKNAHKLNNSPLNHNHHHQKEQREQKLSLAEEHHSENKLCSASKSGSGDGDKPSIRVEQLYCTDAAAASGDDVNRSTMLMVKMKMKKAPIEQTTSRRSNGGGKRNKRSGRWKRKWSLRQHQCECQCHGRSEFVVEVKQNPTGQRIDGQQLEGSSAKPIQSFGRRVWLRFLPARDKQQAADLQEDTSSQSRRSKILPSFMMHQHQHQQHNKTAEGGAMEKCLTQASGLKLANNSGDGALLVAGPTIGYNTQTATETNGKAGCIRLCKHCTNSNCRLNINDSTCNKSRKRPKHQQQQQQQQKASTTGERSKRPEGSLKVNPRTSAATGSVGATFRPPAFVEGLAFQRDDQASSPHHLLNKQQTCYLSIETARTDSERGIVRGSGSRRKNRYNIVKEEERLNDEISRDQTTSTSVFVLGNSDLEESVNNNTSTTNTDNSTPPITWIREERKLNSDHNHCDEEVNKINNRLALGEISPAASSVICEDNNIIINKQQTMQISSEVDDDDNCLLAGGSGNPSEASKEEQKNNNNKPVKVPSGTGGAIQSLTLQANRNVVGATRSFSSSSLTGVRDKSSSEEFDSSNTNKRKIPTNTEASAITAFNQQNNDKGDADDGDKHDDKVEVARLEEEEEVKVSGQRPNIRQEQGVKVSGERHLSGTSSSSSSCSNRSSGSKDQLRMGQQMAAEKSSANGVNTTPSGIIEPSTKESLSSMTTTISTTKMTTSQQTACWLSAEENHLQPPETSPTSQQKQQQQQVKNSIGDSQLRSYKCSQVAQGRRRQPTTNDHHYITCTYRSHHQSASSDSSASSSPSASSCTCSGTGSSVSSTNSSSCHLNSASNQTTHSMRSPTICSSLAALAGSILQLSTATPPTRTKVTCGPRSSCSAATRTSPSSLSEFGNCSGPTSPSISDSSSIRSSASMEVARLMGGDGGSCQQATVRRKSGGSSEQFVNLPPPPPLPPQLPTAIPLNRPLKKQTPETNQLAVFGDHPLAPTQNAQRPHQVHGGCNGLTTNDQTFSHARQVVSGATNTNTTTATATKLPRRPETLETSSREHIAKVVAIDSSTITVLPKTKTNSNNTSSQHEQTNHTFSAADCSSRPLTAHYIR